MSDLLYHRKVRLTCQGSGGKILINHDERLANNLKIAFDVSKSISSTQNEAEITVFNLSESSRNALGKELDEVILEAGYWPPGGEDNTGIIFKGQIRDVEHSRDGPTIVTRLKTGDGDKAIRKATVSKSYPSGTAVQSVMEDIAKQMQEEGVVRGEWKLPEGDLTFHRPYAAVGSAKREMDQLGRGFGFYWSIQNGVLEVIPGDGYVGGITLISPQSGMIYSPTITDNGVKVSVLLDPSVRPGRRVRIESHVMEMNAQEGEYRVGECRFSGDNRDGDMIVFIFAESVVGKKVDEGKKNETVENSSVVDGDYGGGGEEPKPPVPLTPPIEV